MWELWSKRLIGLFSVKSIVTLILTAVFAALAISGKVSSQDFFTIFSVVNSMPVAIIADPGNAVAAGFDFGREKEKTPGCDDGTVLPGQCSGT